MPSLAVGQLCISSIGRIPQLDPLLGTPFEADPGAPERLIDDIEEALGGVDILAVNHGVARQARYEDVDAAAFDHTLAVNLRAPFLLAHRVLPGMRERGFGRVLFISSVAAFRGGVIGPDYASSKASIDGGMYPR